MQEGCLHVKSLLETIFHLIKMKRWENFAMKMTLISFLWCHIQRTYANLLTWHFSAQWRQPGTKFWPIGRCKMLSWQLYQRMHFLIYWRAKALNKMDQAQPKPNSPYKDISFGIKRNMMSGFCASGIYPFNKQKVLDRLPKDWGAGNRKYFDQIFWGNHDTEALWTNLQEKEDV